MNGTGLPAAPARPCRSGPSSSGSASSYAEGRDDENNANDQHRGREIEAEADGRTIALLSGSGV
ncbi:MAG: hypothetical protein ACOC0P_04700, partial [Planctomycetota bacterium]